jgi:DNA-directed RNA polymerase specialized sigma24 family protein
MSVEDTAAALGVSPRTVKSDWALARAWLYDALRGHA